jgi:hypothetical protein
MRSRGSDNGNSNDRREVDMNEQEIKKHAVDVAADVHVAQTTEADRVAVRKRFTDALSKRLGIKEEVTCPVCGKVMQIIEWEDESGFYRCLTCKSAWLSNADWESIRAQIQTRIDEAVEEKQKRIAALTCQKNACQQVISERNTEISQLRAQLDAQSIWHGMGEVPEAGWTHPELYGLSVNGIYPMDTQEKLRDFEENWTIPRKWAYKSDLLKQAGIGHAKTDSRDSIKVKQVEPTKEQLDSAMKRANENSKNWVDWNSDAKKSQEGAGITDDK